MSFKGSIDEAVKEISGFGMDGARRLLEDIRKKDPKKITKKQIERNLYFYGRPSVPHPRDAGGAS